MREFEWGITNGVFRKESELLLVDINTLDGQVTPNKAGVPYPLPVAKFPDLRMVEIIAHPQELLTLHAGGMTAADLGSVLLSVRRADGTWMLIDIAAGSLMPPLDAKHRRRPKFFEPTVIDTRNSFLYTTGDGFKGPVALEIVYV